MNPETKICQNCKSSFIIEPEDFKFYEKIKVPPPTWCPECQLMRRLIFRNEHNLYRRKEAAEGREIISMFSQDKPVVVFSQDYWLSDKWDQLAYGMNYDFSQPFFEQMKELLGKMPLPALLNINAVNSEYCNYTFSNKNCYLVFGGDFNEDCAYGTFNMYSKDSFDLYWVNKCELCYEDIDSENCYKVFFSTYARDSTESSFLYNCSNVNNSLGCVNLRNKSYCIFNKQYAKEEYRRKLEEFGFGSFRELNGFKERFKEFILKFPRRYAEIVKSVNITGHNVHNTKNCKNCFDVYDNAEDCKNLLIAGWELKDSRNSDHVGHKAELMYEFLGGGRGASRILFSYFCHSSHDIQYSFNCRSSSNLFACIGLRNKSYCILNKQYTKEEYEKLVPKIIEHMNSMPYIDQKGRVYKYGEFFPPELSPFSYNETIAQEYFPLTKDQALDKGYSWKDPEPRNYEITLKTEDLPDHIKDVPDSILNEIIQCAHFGHAMSKCNEQCTEAYKIIPQELQFLRKMNLPLPRLCPNCRHYQRIKQRNPLKLWHRKCQCAGLTSENKVYQNTADHVHHKKDEHCPSEFETTYAPERPEIVYCEQCYLREVV